MRIREKAGAARGEGRRQGMTLIEVIFAMAVFSIMLCAFLIFQFSTLQADRVASRRTSGTVTLRRQMEQSVADAYENMGFETSIAQGLLLYLDGLRNGADVRLVGDAIVYTFPVPLPGEALVFDEESQELKNLDENAVGTFTVYLREDNVPAEFIGWSTLYDGGSSSSNNDGFDMNGNRSTGDDFSGLFGGNGGAFEQSGLNSLPVQGEIRYYNSADDKAHGRPAYSVFRNFIVNGDSFVKEEFELYQDP